MNRRLIPIVAGVLASVAAADAYAVPANYLPLEIGRTWFYDGDEGTDQITTIESPVSIQGVLTTARLQENSGANEDMFRNFWTRNEEGDLFLHAAQNLGAGLAWRYEPPILYLDAPLEVGKTWTTRFNACEDIGAGPCTEALAITFLVTAEGAITVTAGTFSTFEVQEVEPSPDLTFGDDVRFNLLGHRLPEDHGASDGGAHDWYADGVGVVRQDVGGETLNLVVVNSPTPTLDSTWSTLKSLFQ